MDIPLLSLESNRGINCISSSLDDLGEAELSDITSIHDERQNCDNDDLSEEDESDDENSDIFPSDFFHSAEITAPTPNQDNFLEVKNVDDLIAKEMSAMSMEDREAAYFDVHGIAPAIKETPELLAESLLKMDKALEVLANSWEAYQLAFSMNPHYVQNPQFRLRFLRTDKFDADQAALHYVMFYESKLTIFGASLLVTDITQDILDEETLAVLQEGYVQVLLQRDPAGRAVTINAGQSSGGYSTIARLRMAFYLVMVCTEDVESQRRGLLIVSFPMDRPFATVQNFNAARDFNVRFAQLMPSLPIRVEVFHACTNNYMWRVAMAVFQMGVSSSVRMRSRIHLGDRNECLFRLQTFGIVVEDFPIDENGDIKVERFREIVKKRRNYERLRKEGTHDISRRAGVLPRRSDVLLGRLKWCYNFPGNVKLRAMVAERAEMYDECGMWERREMNADIVSMVQKLSGRFLVEDDAGWIEVTDHVARQKVAHAFRTLRSRKGGDSSKASQERKKQKDSSQLSMPAHKRRPSSQGR